VRRILRRSPLALGPAWSAPSPRPAPRRRPPSQTRRARCSACARARANVRECVRTCLRLRMCVASRKTLSHKFYGQRRVSATPSFALTPSLSPSLLSPNRFCTACMGHGVSANLPPTRAYLHAAATTIRVNTRVDHVGAFYPAPSAGRC
jgi:hypothetical protein